MKILTLDELIQYSNEDVLSRFTDLFHVTQQEAEDIFTETKKFLFIANRPGVFIPDELLILDEMWHNFILFTQEYKNFCERYFGAYLHHTPSSKEEKLLHRQQREVDATTFQKKFNDKLSKMISVTYDELGQETVVKWFRQYPVQYSKEVIKNLRKN